MRNDLRYLFECLLNYMGVVPPADKLTTHQGKSVGRSVEIRPILRRCAVKNVPLLTAACVPYQL